jgi:predicted O-methyltransferase YrrM
MDANPGSDVLPRSTSTVSFEQLLGSKILVHGGRSITWAIHPSLAAFLDEHVTAESTVLETGSGLSTLVILRRGVKRHIAIQPDADEFAVIRDFCDRHGIDHRPLTAVVARSQDYLPAADLPDLDLVLIDGDHAFPAPFIDWYYTADRLRPGGLMIVDDIGILTGTILADFLDADARWQQVLRPRDSNRFAVYRKISHPIHDGAWMAQEYLRRNYPAKSLKITLRPPISSLERSMVKVLPWRLQERLRAAIGWPRLPWSDWA